MLAVFNRPSDPVLEAPTDTAISSFLLRAFAAAQNGSRVWGTFFHWNQRHFSEELLDIAKSKLLRLSITAGDYDYEVSDSAQEFFGDISSGGVWKRLAGPYVNHNKFLLFDSLNLNKIGAGRGVHVIGEIPKGNVSALYLSSANITSGDDKKHNAGILVPINAKGHAELQRTYGAIHVRYSFLSSLSELIEQRDLDLAIGMFSLISYKTVRAGPIKLYFYPRYRGSSSRNSIDTILHILENCQHYGHDVPGETCRVHLVTPRFRDTRVGVAQALKQLYEHQAEIYVVTRSKTDLYEDDDPEMGEEVEEILRACSTRYYQNSSAGFNIHSKYLLLDAPYEQSDGSYKRQRLVWVGTPNLTGSALETHWELLAKVYETGESYGVFLNDFQFLVANATLQGKPPGTA